MTKPKPQQTELENIRDFGHKSLVCWTNDGLKRERMAEKESQMRKYYRGIPINSKEFVYGWYAETEGKHYIINPDAGMAQCNCGGHGFAGFVEVIPKTVGQQIGLKDKNGKGIDVYVDDIVICSCDSASKLRFKGVIKYSAPEFYLACFWEEIDGEQCSYPVGGNTRSLIRGFWSIDEIIGNIHTTPEILEQENG